MIKKEKQKEECVVSEKEFFEIGGFPGSKSANTDVPETNVNKMVEGCLKPRLKGDPNLVSTTMRSVEGSEL
jgi:hypothetical protein